MQYPGLFCPDNMFILDYFKKPHTVNQLVKASGMTVSRAYRQVKQLVDAKMLLIIGEIKLFKYHPAAVYASNVDRMSQTDNEGRRIIRIELKDGTVLEEKFSA